jgi:hypothetical protein
MSVVLRTNTRMPLASVTHAPRSASQHARYVRRIAPPLAAAVALCLSIVALPSLASAQRADCYGRQDDPRLRTPSSDFPGLFDANMAADGTVVGYLPWLSLFWGVNDRLTLGTNLLYALPLVTGSPGALLSARYRFYSTPDVQTVIDVLAGGFRVHDEQSNELIRHTLLLTSVHTAFSFGDAHELTVSLLAGNLDVAIDTTKNSDDVALTGVGVAVAYVFAPLHWFALNALVVATPIVTGVAETRSLRVEANLAASSGFFDRLLYRAHASFRVGRHWLFEAGALGAGVHILPWVNIAFRVG